MHNQNASEPLPAGAQVESTPVDFEAIEKDIATAAGT
jgi:hypothetical protein